MPWQIRPAKPRHGWRKSGRQTSAADIYWLPSRAFLTPTPTLAQRIVRAKTKIRDAKIPYQVPAPAELPERLDSVLRVVYLVCNEDYSASSGATLTRRDLSEEAK